MLLPRQTCRRRSGRPLARGSRSERLDRCLKRLASRPCVTKHDTCTPQRTCVRGKPLRVDEDAYGNILHPVAFTVAAVSQSILDSLSTGDVHTDLDAEFSTAGQALTATPAPTVIVAESWEITDGADTYLIVNDNNESLIVRDKSDPAEILFEIDAPPRAIMDDLDSGTIHATLNAEFVAQSIVLVAPVVTETGKAWEIHDGDGERVYLLKSINGDLVVRRKLTPRTSILYSGEQTDASGLQYLRARYYDPANGRFNRLDPFAGNNSDPQSLHKYLYAHGNPVMNVDPTGLFSIVSIGAASGIRSNLNSLTITAADAVTQTLGFADTTFDPLTAAFLFAIDLAKDLVDLASPAASAAAVRIVPPFPTAVGGSVVRGLRATATGGLLGQIARKRALQRFLAQGANGPLKLLLSGLEQRASRVHRLLDDVARGRRTTAVLQTNGGRIVGGGAKRDLDARQRALVRQLGDIAAKLPGEDAEIVVLRDALDRGLTPKAIATTRDFCPACRATLQNTGAIITSNRTAIWP